MNANGKSVPIMCIIIGKQRAAVDVMDRVGSIFVEEWYNVSDSAPHITLLVKKGFKAK
jgi:hypothetical protein